MTAAAASAAAALPAAAAVEDAAYEGGISVGQESDIATSKLNYP